MLQKIILRKYEKIAEKLVTDSIILYNKFKSAYGNEKDILWACLVEFLRLDNANIPSEQKDKIKDKYLLSDDPTPSG